jgi:hypothetical protein
LAKITTFVSIALSALKDKGLFFFLNRLFDYAASFSTWQYYKRFPPNKTFLFQNRSHAYFYNFYNITWKNERTIEVPIVWSYVEQCRGKRVLEVGNVLSWYFPIHHEVLDKYEIADGVINEDIVDFKPPEKYDLIVSISTLEHVGWDETPRQPQKVFQAVEHLKTLLAPNGKLIITVPLGYNTALDGFIKSEQLRFTTQVFMKRGSHNPEWAEINSQEALAIAARGFHFRPQAIMVGLYQN